MTIAWAIIIVAVLFLLDRHGQLTKTVRAAVLIAVAVIVGVAVMLGYRWMSEKWQDYHFSKTYDCFNPSTRNVRPTSGNPPYCDSVAGEQLHTRGTPLPPDEYNTPIPDGALVGDSKSEFVPNTTDKPDAARDFRYTKYPDGYMADKLCSAIDQGFCYSFNWKPWIKQLELQTAGERTKELIADTGTAGPGNLVISWDSQQRVVFWGCRPHFCLDASAYFIVAPDGRVMDIVWQRGEDVDYLGPNASLLSDADAYDWLKEVAH